MEHIAGRKSWNLFSKTVRLAMSFNICDEVHSQAGDDIQRIKQMGINHIIFGYNFIPIGRDGEPNKKGGWVNVNREVKQAQDASAWTTA